MKKTLYHQQRNTDDILFTAYEYARNDAEINEMHFHKNFEILVAISGQTEVSVDGETFVLNRGDAVLIQPFRIHSLTVKENSKVWCSTVSERLLKTIANLTSGKIAKNPVFKPSETTINFFLSTLTAHFGTRSGWNRTLTPDKELAVKACMYAMGSEFIAKVDLEPHSKGVDSVAVDVVQFIEENFRQDVSLKDLAEKKGYNYQYLSRTFNKVFCVNFKRMLNQYRMDYALIQLHDTTVPIAQVAIDSGFQSVRSFNHVCMELLGKTPKDIRNFKED